MTPTRRVDVTRVAGRTVTRTTDVAAAEEPLDVRLHGKSFAVIMRTPGDDKALAAGFLLSERIIRSFEDVGAIEHCRHPDQRKAHHVLDVYLVGAAASRVRAMLEQRRQVIATSSCGVCGRSTIDELLGALEPLPSTGVPRRPLDVIRALPDRLRARSRRSTKRAVCMPPRSAPRRAILAVAEDVAVITRWQKWSDGFAVNRLRACGASATVRHPDAADVSFEIVQKA